MHTIRWLFYSFLALSSMSCNRPSVTLNDLIERKDRLADENGQLTRQVRELRRSYTKELDAKEEDFTAYANAVKELNDTAEGMRLNLLKFGEYKREYRRLSRAKAPGLLLGDIDYGSRTLRETKVKEVTDTHISLAHKDGSTRLLLSEAPARIQDLFAYDPSLDVLLKETTGTGTDWLLNAMATAQNYAEPTAPGAPLQPTTSVASTSTSNSAATSGASAGHSPPPGYHSYTIYTSYTNPRPTWQRFSNFTGSYWAPLQNRKKVVGSVNTYSRSLFDNSY